MLSLSTIDNIQKVHRFLRHLNQVPSLFLFNFLDNARSLILWARTIPMGQEKKPGKIPLWPQFGSAVSNPQPSSANRIPRPTEPPLGARSLQLSYPEVDIVQVQAQGRIYNGKALYQRSSSLKMWWLLI